MIFPPDSPAGLPSPAKRIRQLTSILRWAELLGVVSILFYSTSYLPSFLRLAGASLRRLASLAFSTPFVFLLANAIVLTLFANSRRRHPSPDLDLYNHLLLRSPPNPNPNPSPVVDKSVVHVSDPPRKKIRKSRSDLVNRSSGEKSVFRRCLTEKKVLEPAEEMSDEELRRRVEEFIANQIKFQRQESIAIVEDLPERFE